MPEVTKILDQIQRGHTAAAADLLPLVYAELRRLAGQKMKSEAVGQTLQPTALVHEAYVRLVGTEDVPVPFSLCRMANLLHRFCWPRLRLLFALLNISQPSATFVCGAEAVSYVPNRRPRN